MLLSDERVQRFLTDEVVPCWETVGRPAKVTIELGDGSTLQRTLGGNTVLYLCDSNGRVIDAFPGVYTADDWLAELAPGLQLFENGPVHDAALARWHGERAGVAPQSASMNLTKAALESPLLEVLGAREPASSRAHALEDVSKYPRSAEAVRRLYEAPAASDLSPLDFGLRLVLEDSRNNVDSVRPRVHALLAGYARAPAPAECARPLFAGLLGISLDDPALGLRDVLVPGTER